VHILTKILVALACVLSVFLSALTIAYSANADRVVSDNAQLSARLAAAEAAAAAEKTTSGDLQVRMTAQVEQARQDLASAESRVRQLMTDNAKLLTEKNQAEAGRESLDAKIKEMGETIKLYYALIQNYSTEVGTLRDQELKDRERRIALDDRISDLESQRDVLEQSVRELQEQLAEARTAIEGGARVGIMPAAASSGQGRVAEPFVPSGPLVRGRIQQTQMDPGSSRMLVEMNLGSSDGIRENMILRVVRGGTFVGNIVVVRVDARSSVARVDLLADGVGSVNTGDEIVSRL
jgi:exonuclease VII small subunit